MRLSSVLIYIVVLVSGGYWLLRNSDLFWLVAAGGLMLLSVGLGRYFRNRRP
ncbi:hypothetical protein [Loigolactobacillus coryniformis]|jgi:C4-dicarboxylate transporter|uniref:Uncharacterized protein n=1 Tax=Loigolactobacillus coryniformis subsp. coryniformis KCTC 3167 = DSM 20001 TaxID=913848 RepID=A0A0R1F4U7_9LACO|nr:hypothetical protein [Loigolactobacillus coryniformis]KRK14178.1 hypothetical protein FD22_GL002620 [Loigolactobacillus coryniformis subsp. coryniformis KCTC 3167 = DSM 20001]MBW4801583.1 hypothetical protein [Loigolactobacillus coryniformis subsp. torquens]MBW4804284.1 hypothetical protein [Loigolactobacillus coryniformis subsp. torquens]MDT3392165.1 hypothetical protein [Bacillota bacterium]